MQHPHNNFVGLLWLLMCIPGVFMALLLYGLVATRRSLMRFLPQRRTRLKYWIGMAVLTPVTLAACLMVPTVLQAVAVITSFGWDAYADGLRVVNKHGLLSDGRYLGIFWHAATGLIAPLWLILAIPAAIWHMHFVEGGLRRQR